MFARTAHEIDVKGELGSYGGARTKNAHDVLAFNELLLERLASTLDRILLFFEYLDRGLRNSVRNLTQPLEPGVRNVLCDRALPGPGKYGIDVVVKLEEGSHRVQGGAVGTGDPKCREGISAVQSAEKNDCSHTNNFSASPKASLRSSVKESNEYPRPACPMSSSAVRPIQLTRFISVRRPWDSTMASNACWSYERVN